MSDATESKVDVLVIGAGPAGLMCATGLARAGVNVRIIDNRPVNVPAGRADGIQPRTIEVLQSYGLAERLLREGNQMHYAAFYNPNPHGGIERTGRVPDVTAPTARWPFKITLFQGAIENIFLDALKDIGVPVDRPMIPTAIQLSTEEAELQDPESYPVEVTLQNLDPESGRPETEVVRAKYVVGADGAHSWVRKQMGITMDGEQTSYIWGVVDIVPKTNFPDIRNKTAIHSNNGSCMIVPREGDLVRLYLQLTDKKFLDPTTGRVDKDKVSPEKLMEVAQKTFFPYTIEAVSFDTWTLYVIGQRVASKFSVNDRVFIMGDACHTHSPKAGQGMNASINDAHNLAWKLSYVLRGWADMSVLKTYELERRKYAQDLINFDKRFSALFSGKPRTKENQDGVTHEEFLQAWQAFGSFTSGIGVHYAESPIINPAYQSYAANLVIGERVPPQVFICAADARPWDIQDLLLADTRYKLVVFAGDTIDDSQIARLARLAWYFESPASFFRRFGGDDPLKVFDIVTISSAAKERVDFTDVPERLRPHWSKVLLDDTDLYGRVGGKGYETYGIDKLKGALVVVRPDGYVSAVTPLEKADELTDYFEGFMIPQGVEV